jgi:hypothetical protein
MAIVRTLDFLPEIFKTEPNRQFLSSTLDQLVQDPKLKNIQGYIGRKIGAGVTADDVYVPELTATRNNYQLEPGIVSLKNNTNIVEDVLTYPGLIDSLRVSNSLTSKHDRLWASEYYSWDPLVNYDKFINFGQYYWLPEGPTRVSISSAATALIAEYDVTRTTAGYTISGKAGNLPKIQLLRNGNYQFHVNQQGNPFWIQIETGDGTFSFNNQSTREILGVSNNGEDVGTIQFNVPAKNAQDFYNNMSSAGNVDFATTLEFNQINAIPVSEFFESNPTGIDGILDIQGRSLIFLSRSDGVTGGWVGADSSVISNDDLKYSVWRINYVYDSEGLNPTISLIQDREFEIATKAFINYGTSNGGAYYYRTAQQYFAKVPNITANLDTFYYVDGTDNTKFGVIEILDSIDETVLNVNDILNSATYTSPNDVVFTNGLKVKFDSPTNPAGYQGNEYYVEGVGTQIQLLPVSDFVTPEPFTQSESSAFDTQPWDIGGFEETFNAPIVQDYITINRASPDRNAWSRSNRWFHIDVINATASYNNTSVSLDNTARAVRPILEFIPGLKLYNFGTSSVGSVDIIDFAATDAFSDINGSLGYSLDGYSFVEGTKVIFANDRDPKVRNKIYNVSFVTFDDSTETVINLSPADITSPSVPTDSVVVITSGVTSQGKTYYFNGTDWVDGQDKTNVNQPPLFDVFDVNGNSFTNQNFYVGSSFAGSKLFGYGIGTGLNDSVLGFPLKYRTVNNVGDITFDNFFYTDSFNYVSGSVSTNLYVKNGFA